MLNQIPSEKVLFIDIETVPQYSNLDEAPEVYKKFWDTKVKYLKHENENTDELYKRAGIYAEFGKIICISTGQIRNKNNERGFRMKSFYGEDEKTLLLGFIEVAEAVRKNKMYLCAHNGKEFDFPYMARRILINNLKLPEILNIAGKKPWESEFIDTMELWKFGDYKHFTSLDLLAYLFQIPSPKDDIDGSKVSDVFYIENNLQRIVNYCQKDVFTIAQLFLKYKGEELINPDCIEIIES